MQSSDWTHLAHTEWLYTSTAPHHGQLVSSGRYRTCGRVPNMRGGFIVASPFDRPDRVAAPTAGALFHACCRFCRDCFYPLLLAILTQWLVGLMLGVMTHQAPSFTLPQPWITPETTPWLELVTVALVVTWFWGLRSARQRRTAG